MASEYCDELITIPWFAPSKTSLLFPLVLARNIPSRLPYVLSRYRSRRMQWRVWKETRDAKDTVLVCDFLTMVPNLPPRLRVPKVLFQHNVESVIWERRVKTEQNPLRRAYLMTQWKKMYLYERNACRRFDAVVAVSQPDLAYFRDRFDVRSVYDVPTGVDTEYFHPLGTPIDPSNLVFTGSMDWQPNEDAIVHFAHQILPTIRSEIANVRLSVVGRAPTEPVRRLVDQGHNIEVTGRVDDIRPFIDRAAVYVVPLRVGGGTRIKIFEAMAMGKAVVSTSIGAEGLPVTHGRDIYLADDPSAFAATVVRLLRDPVHAAELGERARKLVCERFGWEPASEKFAQVCERVLQTR